MVLPPEFVEILQCPQSKKPLTYFESGYGDDDAPFLYCVASKRKYRVEDGIPVLLLDEAEAVDDSTAEALERAAAG